jgi:hypothetical protein
MERRRRAITWKGPARPSQSSRGPLASYRTGSCGSHLLALHRSFLADLGLQCWNERHARFLRGNRWQGHLAHRPVSRQGHRQPERLCFSIRVVTTRLQRGAIGLPPSPPAVPGQRRSQADGPGLEAIQLLADLHHHGGNSAKTQPCQQRGTCQPTRNSGSFLRSRSTPVCLRSSWPRWRTTPENATREPFCRISWPACIWRAC